MSVAGIYMQTNKIDKFSWAQTDIEKRSFKIQKLFTGVLKI